MRNIVKYLGVDWGEKRIGLAIGDSETKIAVPFRVVNNIHEIEKIIDEEDIDKLVVGEPLKMRDSNYRTQEEFKVFLRRLKNKVNLPIKTIDERLSSQGADALMGDKKTKAPRDAVAAMLILQNYLDKNVK